MQTEAMDRRIDRLQQKRDEWARLPVERKIGYLQDCLAGVVKTAERQVAAAIEAKGLTADSPLVGEEWLGGPVVTVRNLRLLIESLRQVRDHGVPQLPSGAVRTREDGQVTVRVFPQRRVDGLLFPRLTAEVWMTPGLTRTELSRAMAGFYRQLEPRGRVALVLGAGNVASIGPLDVIYKMFVEGQVCLLKLNPVNAYLGPFVEEAFGALVRDGYLSLVGGGAEEGAYLCAHPGIDEIHITGSDKTHDAIVYGGGAEGAARKARDEPINEKPISSELGNVSPVVVVPGRWSAADLRFHAENIATQMTNNAGFNCNAAKVIVTHADWPQREALLDALRQVLRDLPQRPAYYPGAAGRHRRFVGAYPQSETFGGTGEEVLPWALIPGVDSGADDQICFTEESFCGVTAETALAGADAADFLARAVDFCNERLWGTLNACVIVDPDSAKALGPRLDGAIAALRYGSVTLNHWPAISYGLGSTTWGAFPGHTRQDIQSGRGVVHNTFMFDRPQKSVIYGPFRMFPKPPWFVTHRRMHKVAAQLLKVEAEGSLLALPAVVVNALLG